MAEDEEPALSAYLTRMLSNADLDCLIANLRTNPLAPQELRQIKVPKGTGTRLKLARQVE
jgi:hypothetical protein